MTLAPAQQAATASLRAEVERLRAALAAQQRAELEAARAPLDSPPLLTELGEDEEEEAAGGDASVPARRVAERALPKRPLTCPRLLPPGREEVEETELKYENGDVYKARARRRDPRQSGGCPAVSGHLSLPPQGQVQEGTSTRHGTGTHTCSSGDVYCGEWRRNLRCGRGVLSLASGLSYDGAWRDDKAHGHGRARYANGDSYDGEFCADLRSGWGIFAHAQGDVYEGPWERDLMHGSGRYSHADGSVFDGRYVAGSRVEGAWRSGDGRLSYEGQWAADRRHGQGTCFTPEWRYSGGWADDGREGEGECHFAGGAVYVGAWRADQRQGRGTWTGSDGESYVGDWAGDARCGQGLQKMPCGEVYEGAFAGGERCGLGRCTGPDGSRYEGEWAHDQRHGHGKARLCGGDSYVGEWRANRRHGRGVCVFADGRRFRGAWEEGLWVQSSAEPSACRLKGPGLARALAGFPANLELIARDEDRNPRLSGGDVFHAWLQPAPGVPGPPPPAERAAAVAHCAIEDRGDGTYAMSYVMTRAGVFHLHVTTEEGEAVADSPYPVRVLAAAPAPRAAVVEGAACRAAVAGEVAEVTVAARDAHGNACGGMLADVLPLAVRLSSPAGGELPVQVQDTGRGLYCLTYTPRAPGLYRLDISAVLPSPPGAPPKLVSLGASPYALTVMPPATATDAVSHPVADAAAAAAAALRADPVAAAPPAPDLARKWAAIAAAAFRAVDGAEEGYESEEVVRETADERYERLHPEVPVVRNYEDLWQVARLQSLQKQKAASEEAAAAVAAARAALAAKEAAAAAADAAPAAAAEL